MWQYPSAQTGEQLDLIGMHATRSTKCETGKRGAGSRAHEALGGEEPEAEVAQEAGVVENVERAAVVAADEERLREHVDVGGVARGRGHLVGEEDGGRIEVLPDAVPHHPAQPLHRLLPHGPGLGLAVSPFSLGVWCWCWAGDAAAGEEGGKPNFVSNIRTRVRKCGSLKQNEEFVSEKKLSGEFLLIS